MGEKKIWMKEELTCKPLDTYEEILRFLQDPPAWRTLCRELKPHSKSAIKNINVNKSFGEILLESPQTFCHLEPDAENVKRDDRKLLPKTIVCHDMANGYHDDSIIDGTGNYDAYTFYNWGGVDTFIYFSHHLITIPPLGWINIGHAHGVKVLGTVITEWADGVSFWERVLQSEVEWRNFASALVAIAKTLKFDGWLINVENKISNPRALLQFVQLLHATLHAELRDPELIWYDSVTIDGHLNWQNGLNEKNKDFFEAVDGFFTNYSWREEDIVTSVKEAGTRLTDLYIGIDVWGRNFYGGGQFNTQEAVQLVHGYGCSLAIFAPAWTHEAIPEDRDNSSTVAEADDLDKYDRFLLRDRAFWASIWPFLNTKLPSCLPFQTSFCRGQGKKRRMYGEVICPVPWFNLRHMQYQPNSSHGPHGYILSTVDNIAGLSRLGLLKNRDGILRCRKSVEDSRLDVDRKSSREMLFTLKTDRHRDVQETVREDVEESKRSESKSVKRKMSRVLRHFFKPKSAKTEQDSPQQRRDEAEYDEPSSSDLKVRDRSMMQMSISLRLGNERSKTKYALGYVPGELECLEPFFEDSFVGGSCVKVNPSDEVSPEHRLPRMFFSDFRVENSLIACTVTKNLAGHEYQYLNVSMEIESGEGSGRVVLVGRSIPREETLEESGRDWCPDEVVNVYPITEGAELRRVQTYLLLNEPAFYIPVENPYRWTVRYYEIRMAGARITGVDCRTGLDVGPILLGHFGLCDSCIAAVSVSAARQQSKRGDSTSPIGSPGPLSCAPSRSEEKSVTEPWIHIRTPAASPRRQATSTVQRRRNIRRIRIPENSGENITHIVISLAQKVGFTLEERDIVSADRMGSRLQREIQHINDNTAQPFRSRTIVVKLTRKQLREDFLREARVHRGAVTSGTNVEGGVKRFYVNERLTRVNRQLFQMTRREAKTKNWRHVWTRGGRVYARRDQNSTLCKIRSESDVRFLNVRSINTGSDELLASIKKYSPDILALNETWTKEGMESLASNIPGYIFKHSPRPKNARGGGVEFYIRKGLRVRVIAQLSSPLEQMWLELSLPKIGRLAIGTAYRPESVKMGIAMDALSE
ncbi:unnamed protein product [Leptosia nina]|uniref:Mannosyl-glycoprotein endo-beta-N-acetylglucosaminidase n=1 Tax=Leptosia nina TaxID=320188 RepID=A0AAV1JEP3_9NEOP